MGDQTKTETVFGVVYLFLVQVWKTAEMRKYEGTNRRELPRIKEGSLEGDTLIVFRLMLEKGFQKSWIFAILSTPFSYSHH